MKENKKKLKLTDFDLDVICNYLNKRYNQMNEPKRYKVLTIHGYKVIFWACGALILHGQHMYHINEDDCYWFISDTRVDYSSAWIPELLHLMSIANLYLMKNGYQYYYYGTKRICGFSTFPIEGVTE